LAIYKPCNHEAAELLQPLLTVPSAEFESVEEGYRSCLPKHAGYFKTPHIFRGYKNLNWDFFSVFNKSAFQICALWSILLEIQ
jgi:hypothetical protein